MNYVKLNTQVEYRIDDSNRKQLLSKHEPSGQTQWIVSSIAMQNIIKLRISQNVGEHVECLLEDGKWYQQDSQNNLVLTWEEKRKESSKNKKGTVSEPSKTEDNSSETSFPVSSPYKEKHTDESICMDLLGEGFREKKPQEQISIILRLYKQKSVKSFQVV